MNQEVLDDEHRARRVRCFARTSASQIDAYESCPRQWFNAYVLGDKPPQTDAQKRGVEIDDHYVQPYLKTGAIRTTPGETGNWAPLLKELIPHLPKPGPREDLLVQHGIEITTYNGGPLCIGFADWVEELDGGHLHVGDLKSTSDFKYCKDERQLRDNTQMITYARWAYEVGAERVSIAHVYGRTRGAARAHRSPLLSTAVGYFLSRDEVAERWGRRVELVKEMVEIARSCVSANDLPPNTASCGMYGGCYYRSKCGLTIGARVAGKMKKERIMSDGNQSRLLSLLRRKSVPAAEEKAPPKEVSAPPKEVATAKPPGIRSLFEKKSPTPVAATASPGEKGVEGYTVGQKCNGRGYYANANGEGFADVEPGHSCMNCLKEVRVEIAPDQVLPPETVNQRTSTPEEVEAVEAAVKQKGRPKKEVGEAKPAKKMKIKIECKVCDALVPDDEYEEHLAAHDAAESSTITEVAKPVATAVEPPAPKRDPKVAELSKKLEEEMANEGAEPRAHKAPRIKPRIYVNALPSKLPDGLVAAAVTLEEWLAPMTELVATANDVADIRLLPYGAAKGGLATAIRECIESCPAVLLVSSRHPDAALALEVLTPHAEEVIHGVAA